LRDPHHVSSDGQLREIPTISINLSYGRKECQEESATCPSPGIQSNIKGVRGVEIDCVLYSNEKEKLGIRNLAVSGRRTSHQHNRLLRMKVEMSVGRKNARQEDTYLPKLYFYALLMKN